MKYFDLIIWHSGVLLRQPIVSIWHRYHTKCPCTCEMQIETYISLVVKEDFSQSLIILRSLTQFKC